MAAERIIGVDFGTSTSVIRVKRYENGDPVGERLETKEVTFSGSGALTPTLIMKKDDDASVCYFGSEAQLRKKKFTNFHSFKMDLESSDPEKRAQARQLTEEFYGYLAKQYKNQSEGGHLGSPDDKERTIVSYPVKWNEGTKSFMLKAAAKAGFPNVTGMDEAQAAIQAVIVMNADHLEKHGLLKAGKGTNVLLIDMGAGTTDLVLACYTPGSEEEIEVLNTWPKSGEVRFGGREIDQLLQGFFRQRLDEEDADMIFRRIGSDKFKSWKEEIVSPALRKNDSVSDFEVLDSCVEMMGIDLEDYCLDRAAFESCLADYLKQFPMLIDGCLKNAGMTGADIDLVIVTGGHSQWYFVADMLQGKMPHLGNVDLPRIKENPARIIPISRPQETVALGLVYSGIQTKQEPVRPEPVQPEPVQPEPVRPAEQKVWAESGRQGMKSPLTGERMWENIMDTVRTTSDTVRQTVQQAADQRRAQELEAARRKAEAMQVDPKDIPYTPESEFELVSKNGNYVIRKYIGSSPVVSIPPTIRGIKVAEIGFCAFGGPTIVQGNKTIEMVVIPDTVRNIGHRAFTGCFNLNTVIAHSGIETIGEGAFWGCEKLSRIDFDMGDTLPWHVTFPPTLKKIGAGSFNKAVSMFGKTFLKEIRLSRKTKVQNPLGGKTFSESYCSVFYYD